MKFTGRNVYISKKAQIGKNVRIGDNTSILDNVFVADDSVIGDNCIIGEPIAEFYNSDKYQNTETIIGKNALIRSHSVIYAAVNIGSQFQTGHRVTIRENTIIGDSCAIGTNSDLQGHQIIGNHCHFHSNVHICQFSAIGDYVFIYPGVVFANDKRPPTELVKGPSIGDYTQIGIQSSLIGDVTIGEHCLIGAQTLVGRSFDDYSFIIGSPGRRKGDVRDLKDESGKPLYPWNERFSRGMPWQNLD